MSGYLVPVGKAERASSGNPSAGRLAAGTAFGWGHDAMVARTGHKGRAIRRKFGYGVAGALPGAVLANTARSPEGRVAGVGAELLGMYGANAAATRRSNRLGDLRAEPRSKVGKGLFDLPRFAVPVTHHIESERPVQLRVAFGRGSRRLRDAEDAHRQDREVLLAQQRRLAGAGAGTLALAGAGGYAAGRRRKVTKSAALSSQIVARTPDGKYASHANALTHITLVPKHSEDSRLVSVVRRADRRGGLAPMGSSRTRSTSPNSKIPNGNARGSRIS